MTVNGKFISPDGSVTAGQGVVVELLDRCLFWADLCLERFDLRGISAATWTNHCLERGR